MSTAKWAYVGSRTTKERNAQGCGVSAFRYNCSTLGLDLVQSVSIENPSYLALSRNGERLYTVHGDGDEVSVLRVNRSTGHLELCQTVKCGGRNPVHLVLDPQGRHLIVSNHASGNIAVLPVREDGLLGPPAQILGLPGTPGPHRYEQSHAKPHQALFDASGKWLLVPDKGLDRIFVLGYENGRLQLNEAGSVQSREGAGPRHLAWHPFNKWCYVLNEIDATVSVWYFNPEEFRPVCQQRITSVKDSYVGDSRAAEIVVHPSGRVLYVSTRGSDTVSTFAIDAVTGRLQLVESVESRGRTPRFITLSPSGDALFALNEGSNTIQPFRVDASTLALTLLDISQSCGSPVCMVFSESEGG